MQLLESEWLRQRLSTIPSEDLFPLLNVGSSTYQFRTTVQPYIQRNLFAPLQARGGRVVHLDMKAAPGVDLVADLSEPSSQQRITQLGVRSAMVCNLLEHVPDPHALIKDLLKVVPAGGYIIVSGPFQYPYHPDPIDNGFRPTVEQLSALFRGTELTDNAIIDSGNWRQWAAPERGGRSLSRFLLRLALPFYRPKEWVRAVVQAPYLLKHVQAFAAVFRKL